MISSVALLALLVGAGCATEAPQPQQEPPPEDAPPNPEAEVVPSSDDVPVDIAVDERYVYWISAKLVPDPHGPSLRRGNVVRWDPATGERVVLAMIEDTVPVEIDVSSSYVYWTELGGYLSSGHRSLGQDRVMRVSKTGGPPEVVAAGQWFGSEVRSSDRVAIANGYVNWLSEGSSGESTGAVRRTLEDGALTLVETIANNLDQPTMLAANGTKLCFRTGNPSYHATIWCTPSGGGAIDPIAYDRFPLDMLFFDDRLHWTEGSTGTGCCGLIERAVPDQGATIETVEIGKRPVLLTASSTTLFWTESPLYGDESLHAYVGGGKTRIWAGETHPRALASDGVQVYFIDGERVFRVPTRL